MILHSRLHVFALAAILAAGVLFFPPTYAFAEDVQDQPNIADQIKDGLGGFFSDFIFDAKKLKKLDTSPLEHKAPFAYLKQLQDDLRGTYLGSQGKPQPYPIYISIPGYNRPLQFNLGQGAFQQDFSVWRGVLSGAIIMVIVTGTIRSLLGRGD